MKQSDASGELVAPENDLATTVTLDGQWELALGRSAAWGGIHVPGCWEAQGFSKHVDGPAFYRRGVDLPTVAPEERLFLSMDAVSHACEVRLNGALVGDHIGSWTPFSLDVTAAALKGRNELEIEVWKPGSRYPVRQSLAGFLPDVATTFGGIWQSARLSNLRCGFVGTRIDCDPSNGEIRLRARGVTYEGSPEGQITVEVRGDVRTVARASIDLAGDGMIDLRLRVPSPALWEPASPALYGVAMRWQRRGRAVAELTRRVGFRSLEARGESLLLNGKPLMLRGALSWGWDPEVIAPLYHPKAVRRELDLLRGLGFNSVKLCLFIPNRAYFDVADEEGMILWQELPLWLPEVTPELEERAPSEYAAYACLVRDHPSVALVTLGCELGAGVTPELLGKLDHAVRSSLRGALVCDNSGSGESYGGYDFDLADFTDYHPYYDLHWFEPLLDNWRRDWRPPRPWIFGEFCDQDGFRDLDEIVASNGGALPWWMTEDLPIASWRPEARAIVEARSRLEAAQPGFGVAEMVRVASAQAMVSRKYTIEALRRRAGMGGYVVTGLRDTPIATSGVLDDFGRPKWAPGEVRRFNDDAVLCLEVPRRRQWTYGGDRPSRIDPHALVAGSRASWSIVLQHTLQPVRAASPLSWRITRSGGAELAAGTTATAAAVPPGEPRLVASIECALPEVAQAEELELEVSLELGASVAANRWPLWLYPAPPASMPLLALYDPSHSLEEVADALKAGRRVARIGEVAPGETVLATAWDEKLPSFLAAGGRVLLWQQGTGPLSGIRCPFWREAVKLFAPHALWEAFPNKGFVDLQFFGLATDLALDARGVAGLLPGFSRVTPVLRRLDARSFAMHEYILEARVGSGAMLATTLRLAGGQGCQPTGMERNVAGRALLNAMVAWLEALRP